MNDVLLRELEKKEKAGSSSLTLKKQATPATVTITKGSSSGAAKKTASSPTVLKKKTGSSSSAQKRAHPTKMKCGSPPSLPAKSSPHSDKNKTPPSPVPSVQQKGKRKLSATSITLSSSTKASESGDERPIEPGDSGGEHIIGPGIHPLYTPETVIVGRGPNSIAHKLLFQLPSHRDAEFIDSLGWYDLTHRTCSSLTEGIMYLGELVERSNHFRSNVYSQLDEGKTLRDQLQATIERAKIEHDRELKEFHTRFDELLRKKEEELQQLKKDHTTELQKLKEKLKASQDGAAQACKDLEDAKTQFEKGTSTFKEEFLKSEEFNEICGPKAFRYLEAGFEGTVNLFKAQGYPPEGASTDFISLNDLLASLPSDF